MQLIEKKVAGEEISLAPAKPETNVIDLMAALQASIEAVKPAASAASAPIVTDPGLTKTKRTRKTTAKKTEETDAAAPKPKRKTTSKAAKKTIS
ncbi:hypothetical protein D3C73_771420 [compost metagenome]